MLGRRRRRRVSIEPRLIKRLISGLVGLYAAVQIRDVVTEFVSCEPLLHFGSAGLRLRFIYLIK